eukprot:sb/3461737/
MYYTGYTGYGRCAECYSLNIPLLDRLPCHILQKIFGFLRGTDLKEIVFVCRRFQEIAYTEQLWKSLCLNHPGFLSATRTGTMGTPPPSWRKRYVAYRKHKRQRHLAKYVVVCQSGRTGHTSRRAAAVGGAAAALAAARHHHHHHHHDNARGGGAAGGGGGGAQQRGIPVLGRDVPGSVMFRLGAEMMVRARREARQRRRRIRGVEHDAPAGGGANRAAAPVQAGADNRAAPAAEGQAGAAQALNRANRVVQAQIRAEAAPIRAAQAAIRAAQAANRVVQAANRVVQAAPNRPVPAAPVQRGGVLHIELQPPPPAPVVPADPAAAPAPAVPAAPPAPPAPAPPAAAPPAPPAAPGHARSGEGAERVFTETGRGREVLPGAAAGGGGGGGAQQRGIPVLGRDVPGSVMFRLGAEMMVRARREARQRRRRIRGVEHDAPAGGGANRAAAPVQAGADNRAAPAAEGQAGAAQALNRANRVVQAQIRAEAAPIRAAQAAIRAAQAANRVVQAANRVVQAAPNRPVPAAPVQRGGVLHIELQPPPPAPVVPADPAAAPAPAVPAAPPAPPAPAPPAAAPPAPPAAPDIHICRSISISTQTELGPEPEDESEGGGLIGAVFILMNAVLGAGILEFPYTFSTAGLITAIEILVFLLLCAMITHMVLAKSVDKTGATNYYELVGMICGNRIRVCTQICLFLYTSCSCIAYMVTIGDQLTEVCYCLTKTTEASHEFYCDRHFVIPASCVVIIFPLIWFKSISAFSYVSFFSVISVFYLVAAVVSQYITSGVRADINPWYPVGDGDPIKIIGIMPALSFAYQCHMTSYQEPTESVNTGHCTDWLITSHVTWLVQFTIYRNPGIYRDDKPPPIFILISPSVVVGVAMFLATLFYVIVGLAGLAMFGGDVRPDVILNFPANSILITIGKKLYGGAIPHLILNLSVRQCAQMGARRNFYHNNR